MRSEEKKNSRIIQHQSSVYITRFSVIIAVAVVSAVLLQQVGTAEALQNGVAAPDFKLSDVEAGKSITKQTFHGKPLFIFFTTTWCTPC
jgi:cytochrome oxidase Cu insertion factor (SCO1/SenC/PrrC family)